MEEGPRPQENHGQNMAFAQQFNTDQRRKLDSNELEI